MSSIDLSTEALLARRALAEKATPGPWASYANVKATFGVEAHDWGQVYARVGEHGEHVWAILSMNLNRLSPEEEAEARTAFREGRGIDPGQPGRDAAFIASNPPETVMADIDEILRLRAEVARLEKEADWLAARCREFCEEHSFCAECPMLRGPFKRTDCRAECGEKIDLRFEKNIVKDWRETAYKAVEKAFGGSAR